MNIEEIQNIAIKTYNNNLNYFENKHKNIYDKLKLFETAMESGYTRERYILEYRNDHFDFYDNTNNEWFYNCNSEDYSIDIIKKVNFESKKNSFKTFHGTEYEEDVVERAREASILSNSLFGNAPIIDYINENLFEQEKMKTIYKFLIFGVGLGLHITKIHEKIKAKMYLIIEPSLEIFRLSLFIVDFQKLSGDSKLFFSIGDNQKEFKEIFLFLREKTFVYDHYIKFFLFSRNCDMYIDTIQNTLVNQNHIMYSYDRQLVSIKRTVNYISKGFKYINISSKANLGFLEKPVLILAAGPSLQNQIEFIKNNKDSFIIVSVYSILHVLEKNNIIPDIVTQYDQQNEVVMNSIKKVKNINFLSDTIFLFASHVTIDLVNLIPKDNIYFFQGVFSPKTSFGVLTAPSIGEITYALLLILGAKNIYLLGLDLSLNEEGETHISDHISNDMFSDLKETSNEVYNFRKNIIKVKGNFREKVETVPIFKISIDSFNYFTKIYKDELTNIYNLSNGAFFDNTTSLDIKSNHFSLLERIDKTSLNQLIISSLDSISSNNFNKDEILINQHKLEESKSLKKNLENRYNLKNYLNIDEYKNEIFSLLEEQVYNEKLLCNDLQKILFNYYSHNLDYVFYLFNLRGLKNPKKHVKNISKILYIQSKKIFDEYISILEEIK